MNPNFAINTEYGILVLNKNDRGVCGDVQRTGYFERDQINLLKNIIEKLLVKKQHIVFYDVGANIGTHTLAIANTFQDKVSIRSFEAQRQIFYQLCGMVSLNGLRNVSCHNYAIGDDEECFFIDAMLPDYDAYQNFGGFELLPIDKSDNMDMIKNHQERVDIYPLSYFNEHVDIIKMDIEGMEEQALKGSEDWIDCYKPVFMVEQHKSNADNIIAFFEDMGYSVPPQQHDLICIPPGFDLVL